MHKKIKVINLVECISNSNIHFSFLEIYENDHYLEGNKEISFITCLFLFIGLMLFSYSKNISLSSSRIFNTNSSIKGSFPVYYCFRFRSYKFHLQ